LLFAGLGLATIGTITEDGALSDAEKITRIRALLATRETRCLKESCSWGWFAVKGGLKGTRDRGPPQVNLRPEVAGSRVFA